MGGRLDGEVEVEGKGNNGSAAGELRDLRDLVVVAFYQNGRNLQVIEGL